MRAATGRDPEDGQAQLAADCILALLGPADPSAEQRAAALLIAFGLRDQFVTAERLKLKG